MTAAVTMMAPTRNGSLNSRLRPMAAPMISARAVETEAATAEPRTRRENRGRMNFVAASEMQRPVTIPRCAALCWRRMSIRVDSVTIQRRR